MELKNLKSLKEYFNDLKCDSVYFTCGDICLKMTGYIKPTIKIHDREYKSLHPESKIALISNNSNTMKVDQIIIYNHETGKTMLDLYNFSQVIIYNNE